MMEQANLPIEKAFEPNEEARQPLVEGKVSRHQRKKPKLTLTNSNVDVKSSQKSSTYKEVLSQPASGISHRQRLLWLQSRRRTGLWVQCDSCDRWRYLPHVLDCYELPKKWYCRMNTDPAMANCSVPEESIHVREEEDLIHAEYSAGSVVWARLAGWPWWPAMVDDCPDNEQFYWLDGFSDIPTHYNVVFFDGNEVTRAWIAPKQLKPYAANKKSFLYLLKDQTHKKRLQTAINQADDAQKLPLGKRLSTYSFLARYKGTIVSPKKVSKKQLKKFQKQFEKKYDIVLHSGSSDSENEKGSRKKSNNNNVIVLDAPKTKKQRNTVKTKTEKYAEVEESTENIAQFIASEICNAVAGSLDAQQGTDSKPDTETVDNDTSATFVPETESTVTRIDNFEIRIESRSSNDFDF